MAETPKSQTVHHVTFALPKRLGDKMARLLAAMEIPLALAENARSVRLRQLPRRFGFLGPSKRKEDSPSEIYTFTLESSSSAAVVGALASELGIDRPGQGSVHVQEVSEYVAATPAPILPAAGGNEAPSGFMRNLAVITCILSRSGSGEELSRLELELGTGVPIVTYGSSTGMRDRLGLLRITIPPEKELVHLLVPALDAESVIHMLIENGRLNRPGKGFVYCESASFGYFDTSLRIGHQPHLASMEQLIAAVDHLKGNTDWRRLAEPDAEATFRTNRQCAEIVLLCPPEHSARFVDAAMQAGAEGATTMLLRRLTTKTDEGGACERCILIVPRSIAEPVLDSILHAAQEYGGKLMSLQLQPLLHVFSHRFGQTSDSLDG